MNNKAQSSVEYLAIVGIALMLLIPAAILFTNYARSTNDEVLANQLNVIGNSILGKAEEMYVLGAGSWVTIDTNIPDSVTSTTIVDGRELVFTYATSSGTSNAVFFSPRFKINGTTCNGNVCNLGLNTGLNQIRIELNGTIVKIKKV